MVSSNLLSKQALDKWWGIRSRPTRERCRGRAVGFSRNQNNQVFFGFVLLVAFMSSCRCRLTWTLRCWGQLHHFNRSLEKIPRHFGDLSISSALAQNQTQYVVESRLTSM